MCTGPAEALRGPFFASVLPDDLASVRISRRLLQRLFYVLHLAEDLAA